MMTNKYNLNEYEWQHPHHSYNNDICNDIVGIIFRVIFWTGWKPIRNHVILDMK